MCTGFYGNIIWKLKEEKRKNSQQKKLKIEERIPWISPSKCKNVSYLQNTHCWWWLYRIQAMNAMLLKFVIVSILLRIFVGWLADFVCSFLTYIFHTHTRFPKLPATILHKASMLKTMVKIVQITQPTIHFRKRYTCRRGNNISIFHTPVLLSEKNV